MPDPNWWRLTSYSRLLLLFLPHHWMAFWILCLIDRLHARMEKTEICKLKLAADWPFRHLLGREKARDWAALVQPLQICLDRGVVQDSGWLDLFCHCQDMRRGNKAHVGAVRGCGLIHLTAGNLSHSRFGAVLCTVCASQSHPLHSSENTPPSHSMGPILLLALPLLSVGGVDQLPKMTRKREYPSGFDHICCYSCEIKKHGLGQLLHIVRTTVGNKQLWVPIE